MAKDAQAAYHNGFNLLKIKVGSDDGNDLTRILHVKQSVPDAKIIIDANQAWSYTQSIALIKALKDVEIEAIEQPVVAGDIESLKAITAFSHIPIIADEAVFTLKDAQKIIQNSMADVINVKLMKCGGISKAIEILSLCEKHHVPCMLGSMLEGAKSIEAALHLAMVYSNTVKYADLDSPILYDTVPRYSNVGYRENILLLNLEDNKV